MHSALFIDVPNILKTHSKRPFPIHREDWFISDEVYDIIRKHTDLNFKVFLIGNYSNIPVRKREPNPIENLFTNIAETIEKKMGMTPNSIHFDYATDTESFDHLPLPGMLYNLGTEHEILLGFSFVITSVVLGKFIQQYSSVKPIIL